MTRSASAPASVETENEFRTDIQGLRAVAVLAVVLYHAGVPFLTGGYVGVDVFFVISGFVITTMLLREMASTGRLSVRAFYARRMMRLLPAAVTVLGATLAAAWFLLPRLRWHSIALDALTATGYGLNYRLAIQGTDYLAADAPPSPLQHFWSLAVEEQFYLVWPVLLGLCALWLGRRRLRRWLAAVVIGLGAVASFGYGVWLTGRNEPWAYFGSPTRAWELALGALIALAAGPLARLPRVVAQVLGTGGLLAVATSAAIFTAATPFPGYAAALPVGGAAAVIAAGPGSSAGRLLGIGLLQGIGRLSYSWYLWHWPLLVIAPVALDHPLSTAQGLVLAVLSLGLAGISFVVVEDPLRSLAVLRRRPWRGLATGVALSGGLCLAVVAGLTYLPAQVGTGQGADTQGVLATASQAGTQLSALIAAGVDAQRVPANLTPALAQADADRPVLYRDGCDAGFLGESIGKVCSYGDPAATRQVVLFGDSHAGHWFPALAAIATERHWRLSVLTKSACSAATSLIYLDALKRAYTECVHWRSAAIDWIRQQHPALVVMSSVNGGGLPLDATGDADAAWTADWVTTVHALTEPGTKLVYLADTPWPGANVPDCLSAHLDDARWCARPVTRALSLPHRRALVADAMRSNGVQVIDPTTWFCSPAACPAIVGNILVYKDDSHMSTAYSLVLAPVLGEQLSP
jgi:peptidoglycan/LPS O-acetylase OafA/YrhL